MKEQFELTDENFKKCIFDLLIRYNAEISVMRKIIFSQMANNDTSKLSSLNASFQLQYKDDSLKLRELLYANYGYLETDDIFAEGDN